MKIHPKTYDVTGRLSFSCMEGITHVSFRVFFVEVSRLNLQRRKKERSWIKRERKEEKMKGK